MGRRNIKREMGNDLGPRWAPPAAAAADRSRHARRFPPVVRPVLGPRGPRKPKPATPAADAVLDQAADSRRRVPPAADRVWDVVQAGATRETQTTPLSMTDVGG